MLALNTRKIKPFLAYTSINQIGFILAGLACGTINGYQTAIFYLIIYIITTLFFLVVFINLRYLTDEPLKYISDLAYCLTSNRYIALSTAIILFSMAGLPPFVGFFGKFYILYEAFQCKMY